MYFGEWKNYHDVRDSFVLEKGDMPFPSKEEMLFATYDFENYHGYALVLFFRQGTLYEVNATHCSCEGLKNQWAPEATTWEALKMRKMLTRNDGDPLIKAYLDGLLDR